jgi:DNA-binding IclR family transcriptional regulator
MDKRGSEVQSLQRAIAILRAFTITTPELGVTEISKRVGLHKSTAFRLLSTLIAEGLVSQNPETGRYRLGVGLIELAGRVLVHADLRQVARRHMRLLAEKVGETVNVAVLDGDQVLNLEQSVPRGYLVVNYGWVGRRTPLHATSTGKVLLASLPPDRVAVLLDKPLEAYTPHTITDVEALKAELESVRTAGYSVGHEEYEVGLNAVAAPVRDHTGQVIAAVSASGPSYRLSAENFEEVAKEVIAVAQAISTELGHMGIDVMGEQDQPS